MAVFQECALMTCRYRHRPPAFLDVFALSPARTSGEVGGALSCVLNDPIHLSFSPFVGPAGAGETALGCDVSKKRHPHIIVLPVLVPSQVEHQAIKEQDAHGLRRVFCLRTSSVFCTFPTGAALG